MLIEIGLEDNLFATIQNGTVADLQEKSFYKINIKRYVQEVGIDSVRFKGNLSYLAIKRILSAFEAQALKGTFLLSISPNVTEYISSKEMYLQTRSKLGLEIKEQQPKLTANFEAFQDIVSCNMVRKLRDKQLWDAFFMTVMRKSSNFSVPGSGKTSSVYGMYAYLKAQGLVKRIIVVCPKNAFGPWIDEYKACFGENSPLVCFNIHDSQFHSARQRKNALQYESGSCNLFLFNYECVKTYEREIRDILDEQTILVFDEVHKVKRINGEYAAAAIEISKDATYIVAMTGTPIPNSYQDIYNLLHILYGEEYQDFFGFDPISLKKPGSEEILKINKKIQPFFCRTTKQQLNVPAPNSDSVLPVVATATENEIFQILLKKHKKNKLLLMLRILQLESNPQQLLSAIDLSDYQYILDDDVPINEIDYADYSEELEAKIKNSGPSSKSIHCVNLVRGLTMQKKPVIIWCIYVKTIQNLEKMLTSYGIKVKCVYGEVGLSERQTILDDFKQGIFEVLITNPNTLAESISLHSICHDAVYFEYSFNLVHLLQSKDRIHRLGLPSDQYTQFYFFQTMYDYSGGCYSMGEQIYLRLQEKEKTMLSAIDSDILESMPTTQEELDLIFQQLTD